MKKKDNEQFAVFTRRALLVGGLQAGLFGILAGRLGWLQVVQGQRYRTLAENNRINLKMIPPVRGRIVDRFDTPLAINDENFRVLMIPEQAGNMEKVISRLQKLIDIGQADIKKVLKTAEKQPAFVPVEIKDNLAWEEVAAIEVNLPDLPGLSIDVGEIRSYPYGEAMAHIVGYVGAVSKAELEDDPLLTLPGFKVGKTGIEKSFDHALRGTSGTAEVEVNVVGREVRELKRSPGNPGKKIKLTLDADLQIYAQQRLAEERSASAVVMDAHTGAVYALASAPAFDPNLFTRGLSAEKWEELLADPGLPLNNKAVGGVYPPGSTFKMVTAMAALEQGIITSRTTAFCPGHYNFGDSRFHCWKRGGHGHVTLTDALAQSCDTYFYEIATAIGIDTLADYARKLGIGTKFDFDLEEERPGLMPDRAWKQANVNEAWQPGETIVAAIGQSYIQATPLQLAVMTARLVNGGCAVRPWIAGCVEDMPVPAMAQSWPKLNLKDANLKLVMQGMNEVVNSARGTANGSRIEKEGFEMAGKTGTAQVKRISMQDRREGVRNEDLPWKYRHHALFVGYAPVAKPRYTCAVVVEHGVGGSVAAAPIARDLLLRAQERDPAATQLVYKDSAGVRAG